MIANIAMCLLLIRATMMSLLSVSILMQPKEFVRNVFFEQSPKVKSLNPYIWIVCFGTSCFATVIAMMSDSNLTYILYLLTVVMTLIEAYIISNVERVLFDD